MDKRGKDCKLKLQRALFVIDVVKMLGSWLHVFNVLSATQCLKGVESVEMQLIC